MGGRHTVERAGRSARGWKLLLLALLPALAVGAAFGGKAAWFHSHGHSGSHVHFVAAQPDPGAHEALHEWHASQHRQDPDEGTHRDDEPAPAGLLIELPPILVVPSSGPALGSTACIHGAARLPSHRWHLAVAETTHRPDLCRSGWPPQAATRSGIAALLRSSHAILI